MSNVDKLRQAFAKGLAIDEEKIVDDLQYESILEWDSVAHMVLVATLENSFDVMLDTDDILDMSSVLAARNILAKHGVEFD